MFYTSPFVFLFREETGYNCMRFSVFLIARASLAAAFTKLTDLKISEEKSMMLDQVERAVK